MRLARAARVLAWICVAAITVLSLVPGALRPHTFLPGRVEHFVAYAGTGFFFALGYLDVRLRVFAWLGLAIASGVFEILQNFVPGRSPSSLDALASTGGLTFGLAMGLAAEAALARIRR
jgi:VanZ family protein